MFETICEFALFPHLRHVISTRDGGVSEGNLGTLNLGYHVADDLAAVSENRRRLGHAVGYDPSTLIAAQQVHGTTISWVSHNDCGRGAFAWDTALPNTDGLIVSEANVPVTIQVADCAPVLIADPVRHVLAVVHAGWRGALGGIASTAVRQMIEHSGTTPADLLVGIGPTLCPDCFEIGPEVAVQVQGYYHRNKLLRMLPWSEIVGTPGYDDRHIKGSKIGPDQQVCSSFTCGIRVVGIQRCVLIEITCLSQRAINLVC
jgi:YfiH family protein